MSTTATNVASATGASALWREHWCAIAFSVDVEAGSLYAVTVYDEPYVLFRDAAGAIHALEDRCPHRLARLSDGCLRDGQLECLYHGWRFDAEGACTHIPQLEPGSALPAAASVQKIQAVERQGIVWLYAGNDPKPEHTIPTVADLDASDCNSVDFAMDLPYGHEFLIENVLDYAHIHIAHDGVRGGGEAALAGPLAFEISESTGEGFHAQLGRSVNGQLSSGELAAAHVAFDAPGLVHYRSVYPNSVSGVPRISGLALYALPLGEGRCRLLYRAYSNFASRRDRMRPRFWEHGFQCHLLEQDMAVVAGQAANIARTSGSLGTNWLPLKSSDALVVAYRTWLDVHAAGRPGYRGLRTRGEPRADSDPQVPVLASGGDVYSGRYQSHVRQCGSCMRAVHVTRALRNGAFALSFVLLAAAVCLSSWWQTAAAAVAVTVFLISVAAGALLERLTGRGSILD
ncbi:MAG: phenylpropionate dioxygenase-like ring-hydroxylating dioxygenase large terminal subunit [Planctomycetota bacterium]|jgi:phenylpropionate dioxygenase-like ring-hydroxylating dioxygenase large terminal subunit